MLKVIQKMVICNVAKSKIPRADAAKVKAKWWEMLLVAAKEETPVRLELLRTKKFGGYGLLVTNFLMVYGLGLRSAKREYTNIRLSLHSRGYNFR